MRVAATFASVCAGILLAVQTCIPAPVPVIYSTDLFHPYQDPDDHFDLACLYSIPDADLRAIILDQGDEQAKRPGTPPVSQLNFLAQRQIPAAIGLRDKLRNPGDQGLDQPASHQNGVKLLLETLEKAEQNVAVIFVGSARDVVAGYNRRPELFRQKVRGVYGFIGDAGDPAHREWNVGLDPQAFIGLIRSDIPFYWFPCFDGGLWKNNGHASFWQASHKQLLENAPAPLQRYFLYMVRKATDDPISYLAQTMTDAERNELMAPPRNLWCGAFLGMAVGRPVVVDGTEIAAFAPVEVSVDDQARIAYGKSAGSRTVLRFEIRDKQRFADTATRATTALLARFPIAKRH